MWDWGNDESIQEAQLTSYKQINIRAKLYKGLILSGLVKGNF